MCRSATSLNTLKVLIRADMLSSGGHVGAVMQTRVMQIIM